MPVDETRIVITTLWAATAAAAVAVVAVHVAKIKKINDKARKANDRIDDGIECERVS